jgi:hypothetical protein
MKTGILDNDFSKRKVFRPKTHSKNPRQKPMPKTQAKICAETPRQRSAKDSTAEIFHQIPGRKAH